MKRYEYQVVPAPKKGEKAKAAKTTAERFAVALTTLMNKMAREGWDYLRADTLPCDERAGLTGTKTLFQNMLVFRRELHAEAVEMLEPMARHKAVPPVRHAPKPSPVPVGLFAETASDQADPMKTGPDQVEPDQVEPVKETPKSGNSVIAPADQVQAEHGSAGRIMPG